MDDTKKSLKFITHWLLKIKKHGTIIAIYSL